MTVKAINHLSNLDETGVLIFPVSLIMGSQINKLDGII